MAAEDEIKKQRELNRLSQEYNNLRAQGNKFEESEARGSTERVSFARNLNTELRDQLGIRTRLSNEEATLRDLGNEVVKAAQLNYRQLGNTEKIEKEIQKATTTRLGLIREIQGISQNLTTEDLQNAQELAEILQEQSIVNKEIVDLNREIEILREQGISDQSAQLHHLLERKYNQEIINGQLDEEFEKLQNSSKQLSAINKSDFDRLGVLSTMLGAHNANIGAMQDEVKTQRKINDTMGVTGSIVEGVGGIMQRIGLRSGIFNDAMEQAKNRMHDLAEDSVETGKNLSKSAIALAGLKELAKGVGKALNDPLTVGLAILDAFLDVNKAAVDLQRITGNTPASIAALNGEISTTVDFLNTAGELTERFGFAATNAFPPATISAISDAKTLLGLTADQAGTLAINARASGYTIDGYQDSLINSVNEFNEMNNSVVAHGLVMRDVLNTSESVSMSLGSNPKALIQAASAARKMGLELSRVDKIADSLLDFESSIEAQLEAQLLTGKNINLAKAREAALNNDLKTVAEELEKSGASAAEFADMNRIQQESLAKALGMSRDELGKMAQAQLLQAGASIEAQARARGMTVEQFRQLSIQEKMQKQLQALAQSFAPMLDILVPIVEGISQILRIITYIPSQIFSFIDGFRKSGEEAEGFFATLQNGAVNIAKLLAGIGTLMAFSKLRTGLVSLFSGKGLKLGFVDKIREGISNLFSKGAQDKLKDGLSKTIGDKAKDAVTGAQDKLKDGLSKTAEDKTKDITTGAQDNLAKTKEPKTPGKNLKQFLSNLAAGLKKMGEKGVLQGALNLIPASLGFVAFIPGMVGVKFAEKIDGKKIRLGLSGLASGLKKLTGTEVTGGALNLIAASAGFVAFIPGMLGVKFAETINGKALKLGLEGLASGLKKLTGTEVTGGALNLIAASAGFVTFLAGYAGIKLAETINGKALKQSLVGLAQGLNAMNKTFVGSLALGAAALAFTLMTAGAVGLGAVALLGSAAGTGLTALAVGLTALGQAGVAALKGAGILALLGIAMIPLTYAISLLTPAIEALGNAVSKTLRGIAPIVKAVGDTIVGAFKSIPEIINSVADGFVKLLNSVSIGNVTSLALLGPALISAAAGMSVFAAALTGGSILSGISSLLGGGILGDLESLAAMATPLSAVGTSLTVIASSIAALSAALSTLETEKLDEIKDLVITTAFAAPAVAATGAITELIAGITGQRETESADSSNNDKLVAKIDELINAVNRGGNVYIDGNKAGRALMMATSKLS